MSPLSPSRDEPTLDPEANAETLSSEAELRQFEEQCPEAMEYVSQLIARMNTSAAGPVASDSIGASAPGRPAASPNPPAERPAAGSPRVVHRPGQARRPRAVQRRTRRSPPDHQTPRLADRPVQSSCPRTCVGCGKLRI